ncbi:MAG: hypothetical protein WCF16_01265, partial [Alphaproteobacteria bacterium]
MMESGELSRALLTAVRYARAAVFGPPIRAEKDRAEGGTHPTTLKRRARGAGSSAGIDPGARSVGLDTAPLPDRPTASRSSVLVRWAAALGRLSRRRPVLG